MLNSFSSVDIRSPLPGCSLKSRRQLIHEGPAKLKDTTKSTIDVYCFLFTDMLLVTQLKRNTKKYRIIRPPLSTNRIIVKRLEHTDKNALSIISLNEYSVPDAVCMLLSDDVNRWLTLLNEAKLKYNFELDKSMRHQYEKKIYLNDYRQMLDNFASTSTSSSCKSCKKLNDNKTTNKVTNNDNNNSNLKYSVSSISASSSISAASSVLLTTSSSTSSPSSSSSTSSSSTSPLPARHINYDKENEKEKEKDKVALFERQRRNLTVPSPKTSSLIVDNTVLDNKHLHISKSDIKRNYSLNESSLSKKKPLTSTSINKCKHFNFKSNQMKLLQKQFSINEFNYCGKSTSTIMSNDSGIESSNTNSQIKYSNNGTKGNFKTVFK
jgi:hypothetical protein